MAGPGAPFPTGVSGNPAGSSYGSRHRAARLLDTLAENEAATLFRLIMDAALAVATRNDVRPDAQSRPISDAH